MKFVLLCLCFALVNGMEVTTVKNFDIHQYLGKWYEVAAIPAWFQKDCLGNTTAEYGMLPDGGVSVYNSCLRKDGTFSGGKAKARVNPKYHVASKLEVTFVKIFSWWVWWFAGDYWVLAVADDYTWSVVGSPKRDYLWILSREDSLPRAALQYLEGEIRKQQYDTCKVVITQDGYLNNMKLCQLA